MTSNSYSVNIGMNLVIQEVHRKKILNFIQISSPEFHRPVN